MAGQKYAKICTLNSLQGSLLQRRRKFAEKSGRKRNHLEFIHSPRYGSQRATFATGYSRFACYLRLWNSLDKTGGD